jgi:tetratricopeptide (TPR) repeat protein
LAVGLALVGNLATSTVQVSGRWWRVLVWLAAGVLVAVSVVLERRRHRAAMMEAGAGRPLASGRVFGRIPLPAAHFQDRVAETAALGRALRGRGRAALVALPGPRGAGKTQLAAAFARRCDMAGFDLVAWINAESGPVTGLAELARARGLGGGGDPPEVLAAAVVRWLESGDRARRLVVFDNVDDPDALAGFLPVRGSTKVIITSNRQEFAAMPGITAVPVGMFTRAEGLRFLTEATGRLDGPDAVGAELGWLPLGLAQAAAYITRNRLSYRQYLTALDGQDLDETLHRQSGFNHPGVLKATGLSLTGLHRDDPSGDASRLLGVLAVLSPDGISRRLLTRREPALGLTGGTGRALDMLASASLITLGGTVDDTRGDTVVVSVHRLTARVIRHQGARAGVAPTTAETITTATGLLDALTGALPIHQVAIRQTELDELVGHILAVRGHTEQPPPLLLTQCDWAGTALEAAGDLTRAVPVLTDVLADRARVLGSDHPDTLNSRHNLAHALQSAGRLDEAVALYQEVLADRARVLGDDHPDTLNSGNNLAHAFQAAARLDKAIDLFQTVLADQVRVLGGDHPATLASRGGLAYAFHSVGRLDEAIDLFRNVIVDQVRVLGGDHQHTLNSRSHLARVLQSADRSAEAIDLFQEVIVDQTRVLGADHPHTLGSRNNLASAFQSAGRSGEAIDLHMKVLADRVRVLGDAHPDTLASRNNLAYAFYSVGRLGEAIDLYQQILADCERLLNPDHPLTATVRANLENARRARAENGPGKGIR